MLTKYNSDDLLVTQQLNAFEFRDIAGIILQGYLSGNVDHIVFDVETKHLDFYKPDCGFAGFSICDPIHKIGYYIGYDHPGFYVPENEKSIILSCLFKLLYVIPVVGHNLIFDLSYLTFQFKLDMSRVRIKDDTLFLAYYIYGARRDTGMPLSLKNIFRHTFDVDLVWEDELQKELNSHRLKKDRHFFNIPYEILSKYGAYDSVATYYLRLGLLEKAKNRVMTAYEYLLKAIHVFVELKTTGISIDWNFRNFLIECYSKKIQEFEDHIQNLPFIKKYKEDTLTQFNIDSTKQVGNVLFGKNYYNCPVLTKTEKGFPSTDEKSLLKLIESKSDEISEDAKKFCSELLENRNSVKMLTTYLEPLDERKFGDMYTPEYNLIGTATGRLCFVGETKIPLLNGTEKRLDELEKDSEFYVYSCSPEGEIVPTRARSLGATKRVLELVEITLDNGLSEKCTPDHKWMLRDGTYKEARHLKEGDSLMPLYLRDSKSKAKISKGYTQYLDNCSNVWKNVHTLVNNKYNNSSKLELTNNLKNTENKFLITHHKDFNSRNNNPENLEWMGENDHWVYHSNILESRWQDPKFKKDFSNFMKDLWKTGKYRKLFSFHNKTQLLNRWKDPKYIELMSQYMKDRWKNKEFKELVSKTMSKTVRTLWKDEGFRNRQIEAKKKMWENIDFKNKIGQARSVAVKELWKTEEYRNTISSSSKMVMTKLVKDPDFCEKRNKAARETMLRNYKNPEFRRLSLENGKNNSFNKSKLVLKWLNENGLELNKENYCKCPFYKNGYPSYETTLFYIETNFSILKKNNHKVSSVKVLKLDNPIDVYDITILDGPNNFALSSGVIVANSSYFHTLPSGNDIKRMIVSRYEGGLIISSDFAQIEVKIISILSKDEKLKEAYIKGYDIHSYVASQMFKTSPELVSKQERKRAKTIVFGILYGKGEYGLSNDLGISREEAKKLVDFFFVGFKNIKSWIEYQHKFLKRNKFVQTKFGRIRYLRGIDSPEWKNIAEAQRAAQNTPIQSTASDIVLESTLKIYEELKTRNLKSKLIGTVHDSIQVDTHPDEIFEVLNIVHHTMNAGVAERHDFLNGVPITADIEIGTSWGGACSLSKFNDKVWLLKGCELDAKDLIERLRMTKTFLCSELTDVEENEDIIMKFVDPGKKVKFKIVW